MIVVSDASPLNFLIRLGKVFVLPALYKKVLIPAGVVEELSREETPAEVRQWIAAPPDWLTAHKAGLQDVTLIQKLGKGEREAISLALNKSVGSILIDDLPGRYAADQRHLLVIGTLGVLAIAHNRGLLNLPDTIEDLLALKFRAAPGVIQKVLASLRNPTP